MNIKNLIAPLLAACVVVLLIYVAFSFATWQMNPSKWATEVRCFFVMMSLFIGSIVAINIPEPKRN